MSDSPSPRDPDPDQYETFVRRLLEHEPAVRGFLRGLLPTWEDVEEVTQEASLVAWRKFADFEPATNFGGWLLTIARFEALKYRRRLARSPLVFSEDVWELLAEEGVSDGPQQLRRRHLEGCLQKLDATKRERLLKVHSAGVAIKDLAKQSGRGEQAFYKLIQRLRKQLLDCIAKTLAAEEA